MRYTWVLVMGFLLGKIFQEQHDDMLRLSEEVKELCAIWRNAK